MELSFSIREYTKSLRSSDMDKCWPFDPEEQNRSLPSMDVRKYRWWAQELDRKGKQKSPKKRSISELFAMAPQITTIEARSEDPNEDNEPKLETSDQRAKEGIADDVEKEKKSKPKKRKITSETLSKSSDFEGDEEVKQEIIKEMDKKQKKLKKKKKKIEVQIHIEPKNNGSELEPSKMKASTERTKEKLELKSQNQNEGEQQESDEALIPLISILKSCRRKKSCVKKGKGVTFSGIDAILGSNKDTMECTVGLSVPLSKNKDEDSKNEDNDTCPKSVIDLNEALREPIDLNSCLEDNFIEAFNCAGSTGSPASPKLSSHGTSSLTLNSPQKTWQASSDFNKNFEAPMDLNSDLSTISMSRDICTEHHLMAPHTVRIMGKDVVVTSTDLKSVIRGSKAQETASSSHASSSYCSDGTNNKYGRNTDSRNCLQMNFGTGQITPGNYMPANYITANPGPVISFPMVPGFNFYHPQFPVVSPPMISFPLGSSVFPQPNGLNFTGFRDGSNNRDKSCRNMRYMK